MKKDKKQYLESLKSDFCLKAVLSLYLSYLLIRGKYIVSGSTDLFVFRLFFIPIVALIIYLVITILYGFFDKASEIKSRNTRLIKNSIAVFVLSFIILNIFYSIEFLAFYPGMFNFDGPDQLTMYLNDRISEANPLLHTLIIGKIIVGIYSQGYDINVGIAVYTIFQYSVIAVCFSYMLKYVYKKCGLLLWAISCIFLALYPTITLQVMSSTKDSLFMGFFALFITLTLELYSDDSQKKTAKSVVWIISAFLILVFRNNCILAFPILAVALIMVGKNKKLTFVRLISVVLLFICYKFVFVRAYVNVEYDTRELFSVPAQQMAAIYLDDSSDLGESEREVIERFLGNNLREYIPEIADIVKISLDTQYFKDNPELIMRVWRNAIIQNPGTASRALALMNSGFWYPINDLTLYWDGTKGYWPVGSTEPFYIESKCVPLTNFYLWFSRTDFSNKYLVPVYLLFAPATLFYIFILLFGYAIKTKMKNYILIFTFVFFYWSTFLLGPVALVRYVSFLYAMVPIYLPLIFSQNKTVYNTEETSVIQ